MSQNLHIWNNLLEWVNNNGVDILDLAEQIIIDGISNGLWENQSEECK